MAKIGAQEPASAGLLATVTVHDDRIYRATRLAAALILPFLLVAFALLYFWPNDTDKLFAWTITPAMTPMLMGAGYIAGAYFFFRVLTARRWHHIAIGFLPVTTYTSFMAIATILHWDKFNHSHISFWAWIVLYAATPFVVFATWLRNRGTDPSIPDPIDAIIPQNVRWVMGFVGLIVLAIGVILLIFPDLMIALWPWKLTPLTARVMGGWFALPGVFGVAISRDERWSSARIAIQSQMLGILLILIAAARAWNNYNTANPLTWVFAGGMALLLAALALLYLVMERRYQMVAAAT